MPFPAAFARVPILKRMLPSLVRRYHLLSGRRHVLMRYRGLRFLLDSRALIDRQLLVWGGYERPQQRRLGALCRDYQPAIFLDIGACWGYYALLFGRQKTIREIHCLEPDPANRAQLFANLWLNGLIDKVTVHALAASDRAGRAALSAPDAGNPGHKAIADGQGVVTERLDALFAFTEQTLAIKIDVEGHELAVLNGAEALLSGNRCVIQIEAVGANAEAVLKRLAALGYRHLNSISNDHFFVNA